MAEYSPGQHPNSIATRFSSENQPANKGRKKAQGRGTLHFAKY